MERHNLSLINILMTVSIIGFIGFSVIGVLSSLGVFNSEDKTNIVQPTSIVYHNDGPETQIRYKYTTDYEAVGGFAEKTDGLVYSLIVDDETVSQAHQGQTSSIPSVSDAISIDEDEIITSDFKVELSEHIDKDLIRIDVKIVIEELREGKWSPDYQVVFMQRGPYSSLDKGPVEVINQEGDVQ